MKTKLTVSIDKKLLLEAKAEADKKHIPVSRLIGNFLEFFVRPYVYCFKCGEEFKTTRMAKSNRVGIAIFGRILLST